MKVFIKQMQTSFAKKIFAAGVAVSTALSALVPFAAQAAAHAVGTNVKSSDGTVWMIMPNNCKRAYTSAGAFLSYGFNSWASVVDANADDLALPVCSEGFIPPQDGTIFCATQTKASDVSGECSLITGGMKAAFTSQANFTGRGFSFANAQYGDSSFLNKTGNIDDTTTANRPGVLVNDNGTVKLVGANGVLGIPDLTTFNSWGYSFKNVVPANNADKALAMSGVMATRQAGQLNPTALTGSPVVSGSVSASLASDNPAASTLAISSSVKSVVTLAKFNFSGSGTITQLQVKRIGVSSDSDLSNVYLFNGDTRLTDAASVGGNSLITFSNPTGLFTVSGSMTVSLVAEIPASTASGKTIGLQLTGFTVANGSPATVSISGNFMTTSLVGNDLAYADFGTVTPSGNSFDPAADVEVFRSSVNIATRDMTLSRLIIRNIGTVQQADLKNFRMRIDGNQVAQTGSMDANGYVYFSFAPTTLKAGTRTVSVLADLVAGSSRNFQFQIRNASDVNFIDSQYGVTTATNDTYPVGSASSNSISSGTMTVVRATDSPSGNVTDGTSDVTLGKFTVTAYGEAQKIETLKAGFSSSDSSVGSLRNGRILINGVQYGSTATLSSSTPGGSSFTVNYTVQPGTPVTVEIHADMYDNDANGNQLSNNDTITAAILTGSSNVQKMVSLGYNSAPTANVSANAITNVTGSVSMTKNPTYANQSIPQPQTGYKVGSFNLVGSSSEDVNINTIAISFGTSSTSVANLNNVSVKVNGNMFGTVKGTVSTTTATSTYSGNYNLVKNSTVAVEVFADIPSVSVPNGSDSFIVGLDASGISSQSSASVSAYAVGQTISVGTASLVLAQDPSTPVASIVAGNQTKTAAVFKFTSANDQYTVSEMIISLTDATNVSSIVLKDGTNTWTLPGSASSTFSNISIPVPANSTKLVTVDLVLAATGFGAGTSGANAKVTVHSYKSAPSSTGSISQTTNQVVSGNNMYVYKAIPTVTNVTLPTTVLAAGTNTLYKFSVSSGGTGTIGWTKLGFTVATSTNVTVTGFQVWDADTNTQITGAASTTYTSGGAVVEFNTSSEQQISGAKNYVLKATVGGTLASGAYVSTNMTNPSSYATPVAAATATNTPATFVWSDVSAQSHSLTTTDWNNDTLVKNLPTDSQTLSKN